MRPPIEIPETNPCTCWPAGGPSCLEHGKYRVSPHHEHGVYHGNDNWDADCCICCDGPCSGVTVERMRRHRWWDLDHERARSSREAEDAPF